MDFGQSLRVFRQAAGLSLRELARRIGVSASYLSLVENGKSSPPSGIRLAQIAEILDLSPSVMMQLTGRVDPEIAAFLQEKPEAWELIRTLMNMEVSGSDLQGLQAVLERKGTGWIDTVLANLPEPSPPESPTLLDILDREMVFPALSCRTREDLFAFLAMPVAQRYRTLDADRLVALLEKREAESSTALGDGIALPHARVPGLARGVAAVAKSEEGIPFPGRSEPVRLVFLLLSPVAGRSHLDHLAEIAGLCNRASVIGDLIRAGDGAAMMAILRQALGKPVPARNVDRR